jgi:F-type H+-transporting ATPase subunit epsilon
VPVHRGRHRLRGRAEPFLGALADHPVRIILEGNGEQAAAVHGGFVQMTGTSLVVLSDLAELKEHIDKGRAERAKRDAEETLARDPDDEQAAAALARADTRLAVAG